MKIHQLDEEYAQSRKLTWFKAFKIALYLVGIIWAIFILDFLLPFVQFNQYGLYPRQLSGLFGIVSSPFLHANLSHLISNTAPIFLALIALFGNYPKTAKKVLILAVLLTGFLVWSFARSANHIGASGVLYALVAYLIVSGFVRKDIQSIGISLVIAFLYGSIIFGIIPQNQQVSWESHLFGFVIGILLAWYYRHTDRPIYKQWHEEESQQE